MVSSPEESGRIVAHETCNFPMKITKHEAQSLRMKVRNAELYLKGATLNTRCSSLQND